MEKSRKEDSYWALFSCRGLMLLMIPFVFLHGSFLYENPSTLTLLLLLVSRSTFSRPHTQTPKIHAQKTSSHNTNISFSDKKVPRLRLSSPPRERRWISARRLEGLLTLRFKAAENGECVYVWGKFTCDNAYIILLTSMTRRALRETRAGRVKWMVGWARRRRTAAVH